MTGKKPLKGNRDVRTQAQSELIHTFRWDTHSERNVVIIRLRTVFGLSWDEIAKHIGLTRETVRTLYYAARPKTDKPKHRPVSTAMLAGNRTVSFMRDGVLETRTWATADERTAVLVEMLRAGVMMKQAIAVLGVRSTSAGKWLQKAGYTAVELRSQGHGMRNMWVRCDTADAITRYAAKTGRAVGPSLHEVVTAGLSALGVAA